MAEQLYQNSLQAFLRESVNSGEIHFLISGTLDGLATPSGSRYIWDTRSWHEYGVDATGSWTGSMDGAEPNTGSLETGSYLVGLAVSAYVSGSGDKAVNALQRSERLKMSVAMGDTSQDLDLVVQSRELRDGFIYIQVEPVALSKVLFDLYFKYDTGGNYKGYTCYPTGGIETQTIISLYPYTPPVESEEYNPILNNAIEDTEGTIARLVEPFEETVTGLGVVRFEKATTHAEIPDSFYTSLPNISGRWLGTKNAEFHIYLGEKLKFIEENIKECEQDIQQNVDKGIYLVYQGSPYVLEASDNQTITTDLTGNLKGTLRPNTRFSGDVQGTISGSLSGSVTGVNLTNQDLTYYSSSVSALNHTIWGENNTIKGTGTFKYNNWERMVSGSASIVTGSNSNLGGLTRLSGQYTSQYTASTQEINVNFTTVSGSIQTRGTVEGQGSVDYTASQETADVRNSNRTLATSIAALAAPTATEAARQLALVSRETTQYLDPNYLYLKNAQIPRLIVDNITHGDLKIVSSGSVYISGTVGNVATNFTLHKFNGQLNIDNNVVQEVAFEHADADGVVMSNVEVAEGSTTTFDSFTADSITAVQDFGGRAGFALIGGNVDVTSDGTMYISLTTEDQEDITGSGVTGSEATASFSTGSLPSAISRFMDATTEDYGPHFLMPAWDISTFRRSIVGDIVNSVVRERDTLAKGTALVSGSFTDFTVTATRRNLRLLRAIPISGSLVPSRDVRQATRMLADLEAGLTFARQAYLRPTSSVESSSITPRIVPGAVMPQRVFDAMTTASNYVVPGTDNEPIWPVVQTRGVGALPSGGLPRNFDFFNTGSAARGQIQEFMTGSMTAINRLNTFLSGSRLDEFARKQSGQYTYVYLNSVGTSYLEANLRSFSGSFIRLDGNSNKEHTNGFQALSGSFRQIWGKFGEGTITKGEMQLRRTGSLNVLSAPLIDLDSRGGDTLRSRFPVSVQEFKLPTAGINGVIYGAFDFKGYVDGGYEGNMVEGTIEGDLAGYISGQVTTGSIEGGPIQLTGVNRGAFNGTVKAGTFEGVMKDLSVAGNSLTDNLHFEGQIEGVEEFPLDGLLSGSVKSITLPGQCTYEVTASAMSPELNVNVPARGQITGRVQSSGSNTLKVNLTGQNINVNASFAGTFSGSVTFGDNGSLTLQRRTDTPVSGGWTRDTSVSESKFSGQFEIIGASEVTTPEESPFTGEISTIPVDQSVTGSFDATVQSDTFVNLDMTGSLENFTGHALAKGLLNIESGADGNLVEGHDRPFFTLQSFSGSVFPEDATPEAVQNMNISDMTVENLGFTSGMALVRYSSGSFGKVKEQEYVQNTLTLPQVGDIIYTSNEGKARVVSSKVYCPDLNALLTINDHGTVVAEVNLAQIQ